MVGMEDDEKLRQTSTGGRRGTEEKKDATFYRPGATVSRVSNVLAGADDLGHSLFQESPIFGKRDGGFTLLISGPRQFLLEVSVFHGHSVEI